MRCVCRVCSVVGREREESCREPNTPGSERRRVCCCIRVEGITVSLWLRQEGLLGTNALHICRASHYTQTHMRRDSRSKPLQTLKTHIGVPSSPQNNTRSLCFKQPARQAPLSRVPPLLPSHSIARNPEYTQPAKPSPPNITAPLLLFSHLDINTFYAPHERHSPGASGCCACSMLSASFDALRCSDFWSTVNLIASAAALVRR